MVELLRWINAVISIVFVICYSYQLLYIPITIFGKKSLTRKKKKAEKIVLHDIAVLICARNEEAVLDDLFDSLDAQTYPRDRLTVFVIADNCSDKTADLARGRGAVTYERQDLERVGKGYAMDALIRHIREDYPAGFDGYFVFDADNVLKKDYIERMNESFCAGNEIITSYRNSKNFASSWVSAGHALWFLRESRYLNHARFLLGVSSAVSGTGYLFSRAEAERLDGWPFHLLTEDLEFSVDRIVAGKKIAFCDGAEFFDEQPVTFAASWHQRLRWAKGFLQVLKKNGKELVRGIFRGSFSCFDYLMNFAPAYVLSLVSVLCNLGLCAAAVVAGENLLDALLAVGQLLINCFGISFLVGLITLITEWKHIRAAVWQKLRSVFTFPLYIITFIPISLAALFARVTWKPIVHTKTVAELQKEGQKTDF